jgi:hypothetical protein
VEDEEKDCPGPEIKKEKISATRVEDKDMREATSGKSKIASSVSGCARRTRRFGRNLRKPDAVRHGTLRWDEERHGIYLPDEECQRIYLPDAAVSSRRSRVIWTQL